MFGHDMAKEDTFKMSCTEVWNMLWKKKKIEGKVSPNNTRRECTKSEED